MDSPPSFWLHTPHVVAVHALKAGITGGCPTLGWHQPLLQSQVCPPAVHAGPEEPTSAQDRRVCLTPPWPFSMSPLYIAQHTPNLLGGNPATSTEALVQLLPGHRTLPCEEQLCPQDTMQGHHVEKALVLLFGEGKCKR